jgi:hypothetical protein
MGATPANRAILALGVAAAAALAAAGHRLDDARELAEQRCVLGQAA